MVDTAIQNPPPKTIPFVAGPSLITFDDVLSALPVPANMVKTGTTENKLLVLLRDVLTDRERCSDQCRSILFQSFSAVLMAAARKTRAFDSEACVSLCDMLEQSLPILRFAERLSNNGAKYIDWPFWLDIMKRLSETNNNMTELRLICMIYSIWGLFVEEEKHKQEICIDWLLSPQVFERLFCHWCPMVRAYYMRMLCWRFARYHGDRATPLDM